MLRRRLTAGSALLLTAALAGPAFAADGGGGTATISATIAATSGERSVTSVSPVALAAVAGTNTLSGAVAAVVTETSRTGSNPWSLQATASELASGANKIQPSALSLSGRTVTQVAGGGTAAGVTGTATLSATTPTPLFSVTGQSTDLVYTGTYSAAATMTLTVPSGSATGAYTGTLTVTLVQ